MGRSQAFLHLCSPLITRTFFRHNAVSMRPTSFFPRHSRNVHHASSPPLKRPRTSLTTNAVRSSASSATFSSSQQSSRFGDSKVLLNDTIYALSSGSGVTAGVAIIRVSGPAASFCLSKLLKLENRDGTPASNNSRFPRPRYASLRRLYHPCTSDLLDEAMVIYFPGPRSFTGEDVVEFHVHGSRAVIIAVIDALGSMQKIEANPSMLRPAERGEFTRRAFENGRMDLTGVEGLADLISAETSMQRKQALRQLGGEVRDLLEGWREEIKSCLAHAEAVIDFGDDVDEDVFEANVPRIERLRAELQKHLNDGHRGEIVRGGARVAIVGEPNAGKSTLLNALAKRPAAIVSPQAGTTRDVVEVHLDLNGLAVIVSDTAGLREETSDPIELEGMKRAKDVASNADITILVHDVSQGGLENAVKSLPSKITAGDMNDDTPRKPDVICVANKVDLLANKKVVNTVRGIPIFETSLVQNDDISELTMHLEQLLKRRLEGGVAISTAGDGSTVEAQGDVPVITRARHRHHLHLAVSALTSFLEGRTGDDRSLYLPMDIATEELRIAGKELGSITGIIHVEEVLDVIFSEFCIGK